MKLVIQIPCYNEAETLPLVLQEIPRAIVGITSIEVVVVDDGSSDNTSEIATAQGATEVVRNTCNLGLAFTFRKALDTSLKRGADIIVNIDGDHQYRPSDIPRIVQPILERKADMVVGDRQIKTHEEFSRIKKLLQFAGSAFIRNLSKTTVIDTTSGFRAFSREAAIKLTVLSNYTYTHETILQAPTKGLHIVNIPVATNRKTRPSRLFSSISEYLLFSGATILRIFAMYNPLRIFLDVGVTLCLFGGALCARFLYFYLQNEGSGKVQSLIFAAMSIIGGIMMILVGILADLIQFSRRLQEETLERIRKVELMLHDDAHKDSHTTPIL